MTGITFTQGIEDLGLNLNSVNIQNVVSAPVSLSQDNSVKLVPRAARFQKALNSGVMLVKSKSTGELNTLDVTDKVQVCSDAILSNYSIRDKRVEPKQNYTKIDPSAANIHAHKGPDEQQSTTGIPDGGMAL